MLDSHDLAVAARPAQTAWLDLSRANFSTVLRSPAAWFYAVIYLCALIYLFASGQDPLGSMAFGAGMIVFILLTLLITRGVHPMATESDPGSRRPLVAQTASILGFILITGYAALGFHHIISASAAEVPFWTPLVRGIVEEGYALGDNWGALLFGNPVQYFVLPSLVLLLLGARFRTLGFERGYRSWYVAALWCGIEVGYWLVQLITGGLSWKRLLGRVMSEALQNGFFEEFLFRGALQSRLAGLFSPGWGLVLQALAFGTWHMGLNMSTTGGDLLAALALGIVYHSVLGLALGVIFLRTHNLLAGSLFHIAFNSLA